LTVYPAVLLEFSLSRLLQNTVEGMPREDFPVGMLLHELLEVISLQSLTTRE